METNAAFRILTGVIKWELNATEIQREQALPNIGHYLFDIYLWRCLHSNERIFEQRSAYPVELLSMVRKVVSGGAPLEPNCFGLSVLIFVFIYGGQNTVRMLSLRMLCTLFIYLLSNPKRVNQKPQWVEGHGEMDMDVKRQRIYFCLCVLASHVSMHLFAS